MVLGNLLGDGASDFAKIVKNPFKYEQIMYAGLIKKNVYLMRINILMRKKLNLLLLKI